MSRDVQSLERFNECFLRLLHCEHRAESPSRLHQCVQLYGIVILSDTR